MSQAVANPSNQPANKETSYYVMSFIGLIIMFGFGYLPAPDPITPLGMRIAGIFIALIFLWSAVDMLWPSLIGILALGFCGYAPLGQVLMSAFGNSISILILFALVLFGCIQDAGVVRYISRWFLTRKIINGRPVMFSFVFIYTNYVLVALSASVMPLLILMWSILYGLLKEVGYKKGDAYTSIMVVGCFLGTICGQAAKPFTGSVLVMNGAYKNVTGVEIDYLPYMLLGVILSTMLIAAYALLIKFVFKPDMSKIAGISTEHFSKEPLPPMTLVQKIFATCLVSYLVLVLLPSVLPKDMAFAQLLSTLGAHGVAIAIMFVLCFFKIDGKPIVVFKEKAKHIPWDIYFLLSAVMVVAAAFSMPTTGITAFLKNMLEPLLGGHPSYLFSIIALVFCIAITQFANNGLMAVILMPVIAPFCVENGTNFSALAAMMMFGLHLAALTPAASPIAAILYGNKEWIDLKVAVKYVTPIVICGTIIFAVIGLPLANFIFSFV